jgi:hypothetical protein
MTKKPVRDPHIEPSAGLPPISTGKKARIFTSMQEIWDRMPQVSDSTKIFEEDRDR